MEAVGVGPLTVPVDDDELFAELSEKLRLAHRRVGALDAPEDEKASATRRLLVISDASKHDLARALARLDAFLAELPGAGPEA